MLDDEDSFGLRALVWVPLGIPDWHWGAFSERCSDFPKHYTFWLAVQGG